MLPRYKPPIRTIKDSLRDIIQVGFPIHLLLDAIRHTNLLTVRVTLFIKALLLYQFKLQKPVTFIDVNFIVKVFKIVAAKSSSGRKMKTSNQLRIADLKGFYDTEFSPLLEPNSDISSLRLSRIIGYAAKTLETNFLTGIREHFFHHLYRFVNQYFNQAHNKILQVITCETERKIKKEELACELRQLKACLIDGTIMDIPIYDEWILQYRPLIFPVVRNGFILEKELVMSPQKFLPNLLFMANYLEEHQLKSFEIFPLRTDSVPKYIEIDTSILVELFADMGTKQHLMERIRQKKLGIWNKYFKINKKVFLQDGYTFDGAILTDGVGVSIRFRRSDLVEKNEAVKDLMRDGRKEAFDEIKNLNDQERELRDVRVAEDQKDRQEDLVLSKLYKAKEDLDQLKTLSDIERNERARYPYIEKLSQEKLETLKTKNLVVIDPGKKRLLYMIDWTFDSKKRGPKDGRFIYSNDRRMHENKRKLYENQRTKKRADAGVVDIEKELCDYSSKTVDFDKFKEYIRIKLKILNQVASEYQKPVYRKLRWYSYISNQRSDANLINRIKEKFGSDAVLIMGDWSHSNRLKFISTPGLRIKRLLAKHFDMYSIDEYRTSKLNCFTHKENENLKLKNKDNNLRKMHSILTYKKGNRQACINRDLNSVLNMREIINFVLIKGRRPARFSRGKNANAIDVEIPLRSKSEDKTISSLYNMLPTLSYGKRETGIINDLN